MASKLRAVIWGAGYRGRAYAAYARVHPDQFEIVGVADLGHPEVIPAPVYWPNWKASLAARPEADVIIIALPDILHHEAALQALNAGYHLLLEKPISTEEADCRELVSKALEKRRLILVGHILRHTRYCAHIKAIIDSGELGEVVSIAQQESAGYFKIAHSFCRGNLANTRCSSPMILSKCSHDFDLFVWWIGKPCLRVSSFGSIQFFRPENRPDGAAERCVDCPAAIERTCIWSAKKMYVEDNRLRYLFPDDSDEAMRRVIRETRYGRCVFSCDNDVPDHQSVIMEFTGGATAALVMTGFTEKNRRTTRIGCTRGEIVGDGEQLQVCRFDGGAVKTGAPSRYRLDNASRHDGGDFNLISEMIRLLRDNDPAEIRATTVQALESHLMAFAAERSRKSNGAVVEISRIAE